MGYGQAALCIFRTVFTMENKTQNKNKKKEHMVGESAGITGYVTEIPRFCFPFFAMASPVGDVGDARWVGTIAVGENLVEFWMFWEFGELALAVHRTSPWEQIYKNHRLLLPWATLLCGGTWLRKAESWNF